MNREHKPNPRRPDLGGVNRARFDNEWPRLSDSRVLYREESSGRWVVPYSRLRSLVVPLDGTPFAEHALPHALAIARRSGANVRLVHVHSLLDSVKPWEQYYSDKLINRLRRKKQEYVRSVVGRVRRMVDTQVTGVVVESGEVTQSLTEAAAGAALVVMATHGRGLVGRLLHGSVADAVTRRLSCPVLLVRGYRSPVDMTGDPMPRHILIPVDGTQSAEGIFEAAAAIGWLSGAHVTLAHFLAGKQKSGRSDRDNATRYLLDAAFRLKGRLPKVSTHLVANDTRIPESIALLAEGQDVDLIAMTMHERSGLSRLLGWSVTDSVIARAKTPVLVFRSLDQEPEQVDEAMARSDGCTGTGRKE